jgi:hypothetical protein
MHGETANGQCSYRVMQPWQRGQGAQMLWAERQSVGGMWGTDQVMQENTTHSGVNILLSIVQCMHIAYIAIKSKLVEEEVNQCDR